MDTELILILAAIFLFALISWFIKKQLSPKTNIVISLLGLTALICMFFIRGHRQNFNTIQQIVLLIFAIGYYFYLFYRYKKLSGK